MPQKLYDYKDCLTNELLTKRFSSQFELIRYAIQLAQAAVHSGKHPHVVPDCQNLAYQILAEIAENKDTEGYRSRCNASQPEVLVVQEIAVFEEEPEKKETNAKDLKKEKRTKPKK